MRRPVALLLAVLACLAGVAGPGGLAVPPPAVAQEGRGPGELWEAFPVDARPSPGSAGAGAPGAAAPPLQSPPAGAWRDQPRATSTLLVITVGCVGLGAALGVAGLVLAGGRLRGPRGAPGRRAVPRRAP